MPWPKISPDDDDAEEQGADQLDLVAEQSDVEDEAGKGGSAVRLGEDGDEDEGGHESAGQVADGHRQQKRVGQVAALLASVLPVEEDHNGCQTTQDAEDNTERYDDLGQQRDQCCLKHIGCFSSRLFGSQVQVQGMMTLVNIGISVVSNIGCVSSRLSVSLFKWQLLAF